MGCKRLTYQKNNTLLKVVQGKTPFFLNPREDKKPYRTKKRLNAFKYKYQGQERQDELNLNWDSFKWRNYDYAIGRFMSVDPLAEKYPHNSTYAFAENKVIQYNELEGLEIATPSFYLEAGRRMQSIVDGFNKVVTGTMNEVVDNLTPQNNTTTENVDNSPINSNTQLVLDGASQIEEAIPDAPEVRDVADAMEIVGDGMVVGSPITGPAAPAVAATGEVISTVGTGVNVALDVSEGSYRSAAKRVVIEGISGGLSSLVKNAPGVDQTAEHILDTHILFYENVVVPLVENNIKKKD